jgi:hypothetical protein
MNNQDPEEENFKFDQSIFKDHLQQKFISMISEVYIYKE